jgi:anthranilate/para-aminobenzoate synthase component II
MILVIDNYDSFTWNLVHYLMELGAEVEVVRNDAIGVGQAMSSGAEAFLISPAHRTRPGYRWISSPLAPNHVVRCLAFVSVTNRSGSILAGMSCAEGSSTAKQAR